MRRVRALACWLWLHGCGESANSTAIEPVTPAERAKLATALDHTLPPSALPQPTPFYRIDLVRSAEGKVSLQAALRVTLTQRPISGMAPEYLLVARHENAVVAAEPILFANELRETGDEGAPRAHIISRLSRSIATVFVEAARPIDRLELLGPDATAVLTVPATSIGEQLKSTSKNLDVIEAALGREELRSLHPHIQFLGPEDQSSFAPEILKGRTLIEFTDEATTAVIEALSRATPLLAGSARQIGLATWPRSTPQQQLDAQRQLAATVGGTVFLNVEKVGSPEFLASVIHELVHAFNNFAWAGATQHREFSKWPAPVRAVLQDTLARYRITYDLEALWRSLHESGVPGKYTKPYVGMGWRNVSDEAARAAGAATNYGLSSVGEDVAEYVSTAEAPSGQFPGICPVFDGVSRISPKLGVPYAKLLLLRGIGVLSEAAFDACVHEARLDTQPGIHFPDTGLSFTGELRAGLATSEGKRYFRVLANGIQTYRMLVEVALPRPDASPLGLHRLDDVWIATLGRARHGVYLAHDLPERARAGEQGLVLVTESSSSRAEGAIFGLSLQNAFGKVTDTFAFGAFAAP